MTTERR